MNALCIMLDKTQKELDTEYLDYFKAMNETYRYFHEDTKYTGDKEAFKEANKFWNDFLVRTHVGWLSILTEYILHKNEPNLGMTEEDFLDFKITQISFYCRQRYFDENFRWEFNKAIEAYDKKETKKRHDRGEFSMYESIVEL